MKKSLMYLSLGLVALISLFPFYIVIMMSTYYTEDLFKGLPVVPSDYLMENLKTIFKTNFLQSYGNSLMVSAVAVVLCVFTSTLIGFAVSKYDFKLKKFLVYFIMITMMVPAQVSIVGYIIEMRTLGLTSTLWPIILCWMAHPFGAFFMMQFIKDAVPNEIMECARLDGCSEPRMLATIVLPIIKPGIASLATLIFLWSWNSYMLPMIMITKQKLYTIPILVSTLGIEHRTDHAAKMTAIALAILPIVIIFVIGSKTFIKGITAGAVKG